MSSPTAARRLLFLAVVAVCITTAAAQQPPVFRSGVRLIQANVLVHDQSGKPVTDLTASDFTIFEDGKPQKVELFAVESDRANAPATVDTVSAEAPFNNRASARLAHNVTVILFDRLNSTIEDQKQARDQIIRMLATANPADQIAFYVLESDFITVLHDFTSDAGRLIRVLNKHLANTGNTSVEVLRSEEKPDEFARTGNAEEDAATAAWLEGNQKMVAEMYMRRRAELTTNALETIANHLADVPGRKSLVWVSGAFPVVIPTDHGPDVMVREVNRAARAINAANIAVYPVDIRGLVGALNPATATATIIKGAPPVPVFNTIGQTHPDQDVMHDLADATGGRVYLNSNAIGESVRRAIEDSRVSYVLGYYAPRSTPDGKFHTINVKVNRNGVNVRHRKGYLSLAPTVNQDAKARLAALDRVMLSPIEANAVALSARLDRTSPTEGTIVVRIDPSALSWENNKGIRQGAIDIVIAQSQPDGKYFKIKERTIDLTADDQRYQQMVEDGFTLSSAYKLRPDSYRIHVIVSDVGSQAVGSLIIPVRQ